MLTELQLEIMKLGADKSLSFGCKLLRHRDGYSQEYFVIGPSYSGKLWISSIPFGSMDLEFDENMISKSSGDYYEIIGHPITYSRLLYLRKINGKGLSYMLKIESVFINNTELYTQTVFERDYETQLLVREFLVSLQ